MSLKTLELTLSSLESALAVGTKSDALDEYIRFQIKQIKLEIKQYEPTAPDTI